MVQAAQRSCVSLMRLPKDGGWAALVVGLGLVAVDGDAVGRRRKVKTHSSTAGSVRPVLAQCLVQL